MRNEVRNEMIRRWGMCISGVAAVIYEMIVGKFDGVVFLLMIVFVVCLKLEWDSWKNDRKGL